MIIVRHEQIENFQVGLDIDIDVEHGTLFEVGRAYYGEIDVGAPVHLESVVIVLIADLRGAVSAEVVNRHSLNRLGYCDVDGYLAIVFIPAVIVFVDGQVFAIAAVLQDPQIVIFVDVMAENHIVARS